MRMLNLKRFQEELEKRLHYPYVWGTKQNNVYDRLTNFIYKTPRFSDLLETLKEEALKPLKDYAMNRWFNFWSAMCVEDIFSRNPNVIPNENVIDPNEDFKLCGIPFDHKTTVFPKGFNGSLSYAKKYPIELVRWLYLNQSKGKRLHFKNRLFVVLYSEDQEHWKLKANISLIQTAVEEYLETFDQTKLLSFEYKDTKVYSDIIWVTAKKEKNELHRL